MGHHKTIVQQGGLKLFAYIINEIFFPRNNNNNNIQEEKKEQSQGLDSPSTSSTSTEMAADPVTIIDASIGFISKEFMRKEKEVVNSGLLGALINLLLEYAANDGALYSTRYILHALARLARNDEMALLIYRTVPNLFETMTKILDNCPLKDARLAARCICNFSTIEEILKAITSTELAPALVRALAQGPKKNYPFLAALANLSTCDDLLESIWETWSNNMKAMLTIKDNEIALILRNLLLYNVAMHQSFVPTLELLNKMPASQTNVCLDILELLMSNEKMVAPIRKSGTIEVLLKVKDTAHKQQLCILSSLLVKFAERRKSDKKLFFQENIFLGLVSLVPKIDAESRKAVYKPLSKLFQTCPQHLHNELLQDKLFHYFLRVDGDVNDHDELKNATLIILQKLDDWASAAANENDENIGK